MLNLFKTINEKANDIASSPRAKRFVDMHVSFGKGFAKGISSPFQSGWEFIKFIGKTVKTICVAVAWFVHTSSAFLAALAHSKTMLGLFLLSVGSILFIFLIVPYIPYVRLKARYTIIAICVFITSGTLTAVCYHNTSAYDKDGAEIMRQNTIKYVTNKVHRAKKLITG